MKVKNYHRANREIRRIFEMDPEWLKPLSNKSEMMLLREIRSAIFMWE